MQKKERSMKRKNLKKAVSFMLATLMAASAMTQALAVRENPPSNAHIDSSWTMYRMAVAL